MLKCQLLKHKKRDMDLFNQASNDATKKDKKEKGRRVMSPHAVVSVYVKPHNRLCKTKRFSIKNHAN